MKTVGQLKDSVSGLLQGTDLDDVTGLNIALERAARTLVQVVDIPEASGRQNVVLYSGVYDYAAPVSIFGGGVTDLRPQGSSRTIDDYAYKQPVELFDRSKALLPNGYALTFEWNKGVPIMRVASPKPTARAIIDGLNATTGWTAAGSASALTEDDTVFYENSSSLRFTLTGSSTGTLTKTLTTALNLSDYEDVGVAFLAIRIPDGATAANLTSVSLKLGSSSTVYNSVSSTTGFLAAWAAGEWLLVALDFSAASEAGEPTWSAINYVQISLAHTGTFTNFRVGGLFISLPFPSTLLYTSAALFMASGSNPSQTITDDNDSILLNDAALILYEHEAALTIALQNGGSFGGGVITLLQQTLYGVRAPRTGALIRPGLYDHYRAKNPSQELRTVDNYYLD